MVVVLISICIQLYMQYITLFHINCYHLCVASCYLHDFVLAVASRCFFFVLATSILCFD